MTNDRYCIKNSCHDKIMKRFALSCLVFVFGCFLPLHSSALIGIQEGDVPKKIGLKDVNGMPHDIAASFGKRPVIIVFWELTRDTSFLNYSLDALRFLNDFYEKYHAASGLEIFGIYSPEEEKEVSVNELNAVRDLIKFNKIKFPILVDGGFKMFREYGVIALPSTIMIDKGGKIQFIYPSFPITARPLLAEQIETLVGIARVTPEKKDVGITGRDSHALRLYHYALKMYKKGLSEQSLSPLKKSLKLDPDFAWSRNLMGIILWNRGNITNSMEEFERAIQLDKNYAPSHYNYAFLLFENEDYGKAEEYFRKAISLNENMAEAHYLLGLLYKKTNRENKAFKELGTALTIFEKRKTTPAYELYTPSTFHRISTLFALSELHSQRGEIEKALQLLQKATKIALGQETVVDKEHLYRSRDLMVYE